MKTYSKVIAGALAILLSAGATGMYAMANEKKDEDTNSKSANTEVSSTQKPVDENGKTYKEETVYVMTKANGSKDKVIVSNWLKNPKGEKDLKDVSKLTDIENTKTDETFERSGDNLTWKTDGGDIYYKGNYSGDIPVEMKVTYKLDGNEISPENLLGKSGKVTIRYDYINKAKQTVEVNGKQEEVNIPFVMTTGSILDAEVFSNVTIKNGKIISDGNKQIFVGIAIPGLKESLNTEKIKESLKKAAPEASEKLEKSDVDIPEYVEITADVKNFEMPTVLTLATSNLMSKADIDTSDIVDAVEKKLKEASDGAKKLADGSTKLRTGLDTLNSSTGALVSGVDKLNSGSETLSNGLKSAADGTGQLSDGAKKLYNATTMITGGVGSLKTGADTLASKLGEASNGAAKLSQGTATLANGLAQANSKMPALANGAAQLKAGSQDLYKGADKLNAGANQLADGLGKAQQGVAKLQGGTQQLNQAVTAQKDKTKQSTLAGGATAVKNGADQLYGGLSKMQTELQGLPTQIQNLDTGVDTAAKKLESTIAVNKDVLTALTTALNADPTNATLQVSVAKLSKTIEGQELILASLKPSEKGNATIKDGTNALKAGAGEIGTNLGKLTTGAKNLSEGATDLSAGADKLLTKVETASQELFGGLSMLNENFTKQENGILSGSKKLSDGTLALKNGSKKLDDGITQAADGTAQLASGIKQLTDGSKQADQGAAQLNTGLSQLHEGAVKLSNGINKLDSGAVELNSGAKTLSDKLAQLKEGTDKLYAGSTELHSGISTLKNGSTALVSGVAQLDNGAKELEDGMIKFKKEAIDKIMSVYEDDIKELTQKLSAITKSSGSYNNFSGIADGTDGEVKFIFETQEIRKKNS